MPLQSAYLYGYRDQMVESLRSTFSAALRTNGVLEKGVSIDYLRAAKEPISTGLSNFNVCSVFDKQFSLDSGFTSEEVMCLLNDYELRKLECTAKEWQALPARGAMVIDTVIRIFTLLMGRAQSLECIGVCKRIVQKDGKSEFFWTNTSGNDVIYRFIQQGNTEMKQGLDISLSGDMIEKAIKPELTHRELDNTDNLYSLLLFAGYLKVISKTDTNTYRLMIPNKETQYIYTTIFEEQFKWQIRSCQASLLEALLQEHVEGANEVLSTALF